MSYGYQGEPPPSRFNMAAYCLDPGPTRPPERIGLVVAHSADPGAPTGVPDDRWSFGDLDESVRRIAGGLLARGLVPGDRVLLRLGNTSDAPLTFFGAIAAGLVAVPTSSMLTATEVGALVRDCRPALVVAADELAAGVPAGTPTIGPADLADWCAGWCAHAEPVAYRDTSADDPAFLVYTSGTTGEPKGVLHAHRSAWGRRPMYAGWLGIGPGDVMLHAGGLNWTYTLGVGLTDPWANGATAVVYNGPHDRAVWGTLVERCAATMIAAVPGVYRQLLASDGLTGRDLSTLRHGLTAGEALSADLHAAWQAATGLPLYEALGMSEISTYISSGPTVPTRPGSPGKPQHGRCVVVLPTDPADPADGEQPLPAGETGLLAVHGTDPGLLLRYWERPDEDAAAWRGEWFIGGDLAHFDPDGYVVHHGRADDVVNAGGYRVSPQEVEHVVAGHPAVHEAGVTGVEVRPGVWVVGAFVVPEPGHTGQGFDPESIRTYAATQLAAYKIPRVVVEVDSLPRTANGKVLRRELGNR